MDCLPFGRLNCWLRLFLFLLLFLLQNQNVWILPNHFLLWIHGRLQFGPRDALWHGEWIVKPYHLILIMFTSRLATLGRVSLSGRSMQQSRSTNCWQYFTVCSSLDYCCGYSFPHFAIQMTYCRHHRIMIPPKLSLYTHFSDNADCFSSIQTKYNPELRSGLTRGGGFVSQSNFSNSAGSRLRGLKSHDTCTVSNSNFSNSAGSR